MNCGPMPCKEVSAPAGTSFGQATSQDRWLLAATVLGSSMDFIDGTVVNVALPGLQSSLGINGTEIQWVVEAYALFTSSLLLVGGSLGDKFGLRRTFLCGVVLFVCASVWCGLSPGIAQLLIARCLQGVGGALLVPNSLALLSAHFQGRDRGRAIGTWAGFASIATACGPLLGGWMVQHASWRFVFFVNVPIALAAIWITLSKISSLDGGTERTPLDIKGALLATMSLGCITFSLLEWSNWHSVSRLSLAVGLILLATFIFVERDAKSPLMPTELFRSRKFTGANLLTFFLYGALSTTLFYLPLNLIQIQRYTPTQAGAAMLPLVLLMFLLSRWAGGLIQQYGERIPLVVGPFVVTLGFGLFARPGIGVSYWTTYFPAMMALGLGMTISVAPLTTVVMSSVSKESSGIASGVNNAVSQTAALLALALSAPLFFARFSSELPKQLTLSQVPPAVSRQIEGEQRRLGAIQTDDSRGRNAVDESFVSAFRLIASIAALSSAAAGITAILTIRDKERHSIRQTIL
jgi:EmrB/QacA subfamily drug resistance transporter